MAKRASQTLTRRSLLFGRDPNRRLQHHRHTGRKLPIHHTSYAFLFFILVLTGLMLFFIGNMVKAAEIVSSGQIQLSGVNLGEPPTIAAEIISPPNGSVTSEAVNQVSGTCQAGYMIEIYRNGAFAGSTLCSMSSTFDLSVTFIEGGNELVARTVDGDNNYAPDSNIVFVTYTPPPPPPAYVPPAGGRILPFLLYTKPVHWGVFAGDELKLPYEVEGGEPAYAISVDWQDDKRSDPYLLDKAGDYTATHEYVAGGEYRVRLSGRDKAGRSAVIETIAIINTKGDKAGGLGALCGYKPDGSASRWHDCYNVGILFRLSNILWPAFLIACLMTLSFWLGEKLVLLKMRGDQNTQKRA